jgi:hypothetical protein
MVVVAGRGGSPRGCCDVYAVGLPALAKTLMRVSALGRREYLERTLAASESRRNRRRLGVGLTEAQVQLSLTHRARLPTTRPVRTRVHQSAYRTVGVGKSRSLRNGSASKSPTHRPEDPPIPIWMRIDELSSALEDKVIAEVGREALKRFGTNIVIDGLDERTRRLAARSYKPTRS